MQVRVLLFAGLRERAGRGHDGSRGTHDQPRVPRLTKRVRGCAVPEDSEPGNRRGDQHDDGGQQGHMADRDVEQPGDREHEGPHHET